MHFLKQLCTAVSCDKLFGEPACFEKGGVFAINDCMKPKMYGDMEAFARKLRDMGYQDVRLVNMSKLVFGSERRANMMMLGNSRMLLGRK